MKVVFYFSDFDFPEIDIVRILKKPINLMYLLFFYLEGPIIVDRRANSEF